MFSRSAPLFQTDDSVNATVLGPAGAICRFARLREILNIFSLFGISVTDTSGRSVAVKSTLLSGFAVT